MHLHVYIYMYYIFIVPILHLLPVLYAQKYIIASKQFLYRMSIGNETDVVL